MKSREIRRVESCSTHGRGAEGIENFKRDPECKGNLRTPALEDNIQMDFKVKFMSHRLHCPVSEHDPVACCHKKGIESNGF
jgi:hypothetical protein